MLQSNLQITSTKKIYVCCTKLDSNQIILGCHCLNPLFLSDPVFNLFDFFVPIRPEAQVGADHGAICECNRKADPQTMETETPTKCEPSTEGKP